MIPESTFFGQADANTRRSRDGAAGTLLVAAIVRELVKIHRATPAEHWRAAWRLLEDAFRVVEEIPAERACPAGGPSGRVRPCRVERGHDGLRCTMRARAAEYIPPAISTIERRG